MRRLILIFALFIGFLGFNSNTTYAQDAAPSYQSMMASGDKEYAANEYIKAKSYYQEALRLKADDPTAKNKLNKTLQKIREQNKLQETFYQYIDEADQLFNDGDIEKALSFYNKALTILPKDDYALKQKEIITKRLDDEKEKLASFNDMIALADRLLSEEKYAEAVLQYESALKLYPDNISTQNKYQEAKNKNEIYDNQVNDFEKLKLSGQEFALRKRYAEAIEKYQQALAIFPDDKDVKNEINVLTEKKRIAEQYDMQITQADDFYLEKSYDKARESYLLALQVIPDDSYANDMIKRIDQILNSDEYVSLQNYLKIIEEAKQYEKNNELDSALKKYQEALAAKPDDEFSTEKIDYITKLIENQNNIDRINAQYAELINKGDQSLSIKDLESALTSYAQASELKPDEIDAKNKKLAVEKLIQERDNQLALERQQLEENYNKAIAEGDKNFTEQKYNEAIIAFEHAIQLKPNELYPQEQINKAKEQLNAIASETQRQERIQYLLSAALQDFENQKYSDSEQKYNEVLGLDANNTTATAQIQAIQKIYVEQAAQRLQNYEIAIAAGEKSMNEKDYPEAIKQYKIALENKNGDSFATQQLSSAEQLNEIRLTALQNEYNQHISKGDAQFQIKNYDKAIEFYSKAIALNTGNTYPNEMIKRIGQILQENKLEELVDSPVQIMANDVKHFDFEPIEVASRRNNYILIKAKNLGNDSFTVYVSYGSKSGKNGGFMVTVPNNTEVNDFIIRIGSQYKWFSEDNTWIEITAEQGNLELHLAEISKSN